MCILMIIFAILLLLMLLLIYLIIKCNKKPKSIKDKHFVITGGSSGIGKCLAVLLAKQGAHVSILARNSDRLQNALEEIKAHAHPEQIITAVSVDVSDYNALEKEITKLEQTHPIYGLINCAGMAICGKFEDYSIDDVNTLIKTNWLGAFYPTKLVLPAMKARKEGVIVFTGSQVTLTGMFGYSAYSSCKFALRGLAESLDMEVRHLNISVTLALPADTDTPGLDQENKTKPMETKLISETGGLFQPAVVAERVLKDALAGNFFSIIGFESFLLTTVCAGMSPFRSWWEVLLQAALVGPFRILVSCYLVHFQGIVRSCAGKKTN